MTAGISQVRKRSGSYAFRRGPLFAVAVIGASAMVVVGAAPAAVAEDMQSKQWYLDAMRVEDIWKSTTGEGIKIALIDSGVNASTPSLKGQVLKGLDTTETDGTTDDYNGHGTTMAKLIAGTGAGGGIKGLAPGAKIIPMRTANKEFEEKHKSNSLDNVNAIRAAADGDAKIINMSGGSEFLTSQEKEAVKYAYGKGKLFFAAVGNTGHKDNKPGYPANYPEVVGVAATDREGEVATYSNHGDFVDIAAPANDLPAGATRLSGSTAWATAAPAPPPPSPPPPPPSSGPPTPIGPRIRSCASCSSPRAVVTTGSPAPSATISGTASSVPTRPSTAGSASRATRTSAR